MYVSVCLRHLSVLKYILVSLWHLSVSMYVSVSLWHFSVSAYVFVLDICQWQCASLSRAFAGVNTPLCLSVALVSVNTSLCMSSVCQCSCTSLSVAFVGVNARLCLLHLSELMYAPVCLFPSLLPSISLTNNEFAAQYCLIISVIEYKYDKTNHRVVSWDLSTVENTKNSKRPLRN